MSMSNRLVPRSLKQPRPRRGTSRVRHARLPAGSPSGEPRRHLPAGFPFVSQNRTDDLAIASMLPGIVWAYWVGSVLSLVFGHMAKRRIDASNGVESGRGMAGRRHRPRLGRDRIPCIDPGPHPHGDERGNVLGREGVRRRFPRGPERRSRSRCAVWSGEPAVRHLRHDRSGDSMSPFLRTAISAAVGSGRHVRHAMCS